MEPNIISYIKLLSYFIKITSLDLFPHSLLTTNNTQNLRRHFISPSCGARAIIFIFPLFIFTSWNWGLEHFSSQWVSIILFSTNPFSNHTGSQKRRIKCHCFLRRRKECTWLRWLILINGTTGQLFCPEFWLPLQIKIFLFFFLNWLKMWGLSISVRWLTLCNLCWLLKVTVTKDPGVKS